MFFFFKTSKREIQFSTAGYLQAAFAQSPALRRRTGGGSPLINDGELAERLQVGGCSRCVCVREEGSVSGSQRDDGPEESSASLGNGRMASQCSQQ